MYVCVSLCESCLEYGVLYYAIIKHFPFAKYSYCVSYSIVTLISSVRVAKECLIGCSVCSCCSHRVMDHCCYNCPVANCTVHELLSHISTYSCNNGAGTVVAAAILSTLLILFCIVVPFIIIALSFYHLVYKKRYGHQLDARSGGGGMIGIASLIYRSLCDRNQSDESDINGRPDQQNGEITESSGAEGITYDTVNNEPQVTTALEMQRNQAYARGLTGQK